MFLSNLVRAGGRLGACHHSGTHTEFRTLKVPHLVISRSQQITTRALQSLVPIVTIHRKSPPYLQSLSYQLHTNLAAPDISCRPDSVRISKLGTRYASTTAPPYIARSVSDILTFEECILTCIESGSGVRTIVSLLIVAAISFSAGSYFVMASIGAQVLPKYTDAESAVAFKSDNEHQREVEEYLNNHALIQALRSKTEYTESRPHLKFSEAQRASSLTAGALSGPGKIVVPPIVFLQDRGESMVMVTYLGTEVCGYPGFVHGGLLATLLDEGLARCAFQALPNKLGMTASLQINYKKPTLAGQYVVLRAKVVKSEGRKAWVEGHIETLPKTDSEEPVILVDASGLFIEPKQIKVRASVPQFSTIPLLSTF